MRSSALPFSRTGILVALCVRGLCFRETLDRLGKLRFVGPRLFFRRQGHVIGAALYAGETEWDDHQRCSNHPQLAVRCRFSLAD
jgi:hypothetical protein